MGPPLSKLLVASCLTLALFVPRHVIALDRDAKSVLTGGAYGLLGGTVIGVLSYPLTRDARSIFIGSSVGLYLGIVVGAYNAIDRDNPDNPLRSELDLGPSLRPDLMAVAPQALKPGQKSGPPAWLELKFPVARF